MGVIIMVTGNTEDFTVCFFGHRTMEDVSQVSRRLNQIIRHLLTEKEYVEFLMGRDGDFDILAASIVKRAKNEVRNDNSSLIWVLPYPTADLNQNYQSYAMYYDEIEICENGAHFKAAFQKRNRSMIDRADLVVCYITRQSGGAYQTIRYAEKQGKKIINIAADGYYFSQ